MKPAFAGLRGQANGIYLGGLNHRIAVQRVKDVRLLDRDDNHLSLCYKVYMETYDFLDFQQAILRRRAALGIVFDEAAIEGLRNKGANRTPAKRQLIREIDARADRLGVKVLIATES